MTDPRTIRRNADTARLLHLLLNSRGRIDATIDAVVKYMDAVDGFKANASGSAAGAGGNSDSSSTERAAIRRLGGADASVATTPLDELDDLVLAHLNLLKLLHKFADRYLGKIAASEVERLRCKGTGYVDATSCGRIADPRRTDDRCTECGTEVDDRRQTEAEARRLRRHRSVA